MPTSTPKSRVLVVINKWWECDPVTGVLLHDKARPPGSSPSALGWPALPGHPRPRPARVTAPQPAPAAVAPRATFALPNTRVEVWCVSDLLEHLPDAPQFQSSSWQKAQVLLRAFEGEAPAFLIAVGTAGFAGDAHVNDSVVVGAKVFMHDGHPADDPARRNPASPWSHPLLGRTLPATVPADQFATFTSLGASVEPRLLPPPISPAPQRLYVASRNYVAVGTVNVTDYDEDAASDRASLAAHASADPVGEAASLETTHGLIRVCAPDVPFLFVSGITDTVGTFGLEVTPREYAQNAAAAHNAGVAVAWLLPKIDALLAAAT